MKNIKFIILVAFIGGCVTYPQQTYSPPPDFEEDWKRRVESAIDTNEHIRLSRAEELRNSEELQSKDWSHEVKQAIINSDIALGMTEEQVIFSWGMPKSTSRSVGSWGVHKQWIYEPSFQHRRYSDTYLSFENGILTSYSD